MNDSSPYAACWYRLAGVMRDMGCESDTRGLRLGGCATWQLGRGRRKEKESQSFWEKGTNGERESLRFSWER